MKILVINTGSSSIKYKLFDMDGPKALALGVVEKIGSEDGILTHKTAVAGDRFVKKVEHSPFEDHKAGMERIVDLLTDPQSGVIRDREEISAVGHRVVHGGESFQSTCIIDSRVMEAIRENSHLAPLHNPANITGIDVSMNIFPDAIHVAVFDTAFHQTIPMKAFLYAIPFDLYEKEKIRRYGFHGTSHAYVAERAAMFMGISLEKLSLITIHLGNGASMAAIKHGRCIDTSMGLTPLEGLVMGTRSGDVDPALPFFLSRHMGMSFEDIDRLLNEDSGLKGLCGTNDMREVIEKRDAGDRKAAVAIELYCYRIKKYIGAYFAALGSLDALIFTAGVGENSPLIRELCCDNMSGMGICIDPAKNYRYSNKIRYISGKESAVSVLVVPTDEELKIALETKRVIQP